MNFPVSVVICTHNPREEFLAATLDALKAQTLAHDQWELVLVDNASRTEVKSRWDLSWQRNGRHLREEKLGLTSARLCGIAHSAGEVIVFVDDDNLLHPDYLEQSLKIAKSWPMLGVWGGRCLPRFEEEPPAWTKPYWSYLALHDFDHAQWGNFEATECFPCGAGICVRRNVAESYHRKTTHDVFSQHLGRKGNSLISHEDHLIVYSAIECGLGYGRFPQLALTHIIPPARLTEEYLLRLFEANGASSLLMARARGRYRPRTRLGLLRQQVEVLMKTGRARRIQQAWLRGERTGRQMMAQMDQGR
jgi:glycosyltransferase involved in cell wall biosynthesis